MGRRAGTLSCRAEQPGPRGPGSITQPRSAQLRRLGTETHSFCTCSAILARGLCPTQQRPKLSPGGQSQRPHGGSPEVQAGGQRGLPRGCRDSGTGEVGSGEAVSRKPQPLGGPVLLGCYAGPASAGCCPQAPRPRWGCSPLSPVFAHNLGISVPSTWAGCCQVSGHLFLFAHCYLYWRLNPGPVS